MKDIRKLQRSGKTYYLYLPDVWVNKNDLKPGSLIQLSESQGSLMLNVFDKGFKRVLKETTIELQNLNPRDFSRLVTGLYLAGYDKFNIKVANPFDDNEIIRHQKWIKKVDIELLDFKKNSAKFFCGVKAENVNEVVQNMFNKLINQARCQKYSKKKLANDHNMNINKNHLLVIRSINQALDDYAYMSKLSLTAKDCVFIYDISYILNNISKLLNRYSNLKKDNNYITRLVKLLQVIPLAFKDRMNKRLLDKFYNFLSKLEPDSVEVEGNIEISKVNDFGDLFRAKILNNLRDLYRKFLDNYFIMSSLS